MTEIDDMFYLPCKLDVRDEEDLDATASYWREVPAYLPPEFVFLDSHKKHIFLRGKMADRWDCRADKQWKCWKTHVEGAMPLSSPSKITVDNADAFTASPSFDLWQLGCLVYYILHRKQLMAINHLNSPVSSAVHDGGDGEISSLFDLCTWDSVRSLQFDTKCIKSTLLQHLMKDLLRRSSLSTIRT